MAYEGGSSDAVYYQETRAEEIEPILPVGDVPKIRDQIKILVDSVDKKSYKDSFSPIYMVPKRLREVNPSSFTPRVVSIGPLHNGHSDLKSMEAKKPTYLKELLGEVGWEERLENCVKEVNDSKEEIRRYYFGMRGYKDVELAQMMVLDACFILRFINKLSKSGNALSDNRMRSRSIALDLVMLENQIPFFVLKKIYETLYGTGTIPLLITMLCDLLELVNPFLDKKVENLGEEGFQSFHILGLLHKFYKPINFNLPVISVIPTAHSAVELHKVGVKFRPNQNMTWPMAMEFQHSLRSHKPTLKMPRVRIDNYFEVVLRNLIIYEQYSPVDNYVTSYAMAMDMLVATPADIAKLGESDVVVNHLGSNEKASNMISSICKDITFHDFYYIKPWGNLDRYYDSYWSKHFGVLKRTYFSTPWKAIALFAGIIVFLLTVVQFSFRVK